MNNLKIIIIIIIRIIIQMIYIIISLITINQIFNNNILKHKHILIINKHSPQ